MLSSVLSHNDVACYLLPYVQIFQHLPDAEFEGRLGRWDESQSRFVSGVDPAHFAQMLEFVKKYDGWVDSNPRENTTLDVYMRSGVRHTIQLPARQTTRMCKMKLSDATFRLPQCRYDIRFSLSQEQTTNNHKDRKLTTGSGVPTLVRQKQRLEFVHKHVPIKLHFTTVYMGKTEEEASRSETPQYEIEYELVKRTASNRSVYQQALELYQNIMRILATKDSMTDVTPKLVVRTAGAGGSGGQ